METHRTAFQGAVNPLVKLGCSTLDDLVREGCAPGKEGCGLALPLCLANVSPRWRYPLPLNSDSICGLWPGSWAWSCQPGEAQCPSWGYLLAPEGGGHMVGCKEP